MNPVLLYTDTSLINNEIRVLDKVVPFYQSIYTAVKNLGITLTIADIDGLVQSYRNSSRQPAFVDDYIQNKLTDAAAPYELNGVPLTREAVKGMIALPDTSALKAALQNVYQVLSDNSARRGRLLSLADDVISKVSDANTQITALYTYYTKSDASATLATNLQTVCDALNTFDESHNGFFGKRGIPGLDYRKGQFVVSLDFIRKYESTGTIF